MIRSVWNWASYQQIQATLQMVSGLPCTLIPPSLSCFRDLLHHCLEHASVNVREALESDPEAYRDESEWQFNTLASLLVH